MTKLLWLCVAAVLVATVTAQVDVQVKGTGDKVDVGVLAPGAAVKVTAPAQTKGAKGGKPAGKPTVGVVAPGTTVAVTDDKAAGKTAVDVAAPGTVATSRTSGKVTTTDVAAPGTTVAVRSDKGAGKTAATVMAPGTAVLVADDKAAGKTAVDVSAPGTVASSRTETTASGAKVTTTAVAAPGTTVDVAKVETKDGKPVDSRVAVSAPTTNVVTQGRNVAVNGMWGSVVSTAQGTSVNVPFFSGTFPGGRRMLRQA